MRIDIWMTSLGVLLLLGAMPPAMAAGEPKAEAGVAKASGEVLAPFVDRVEVRIEKPAPMVWAHLKRLYVDGERSRQYGYVVAPIAGDASAYLGGTMARQPANTSRPEVRMRVSALDEEAMLLGLVIDLENPVPVYVVHQVRPDGPNAAVYQTIVQTLWPVAPNAGEELSTASVAERMKATLGVHNKEMRAIILREKDVIEKLK